MNDDYYHACGLFEDYGETSELFGGITMTNREKFSGLNTADNN